MGSDSDQVTRRILRDHRHLMTEAERCADRAFVFQERAALAADPAKTAELSSSVDEALREESARELFRKGRQRFLEDMTRRILAEYGPRLPRCEACGELLKQPHPKDCFDCDYQGSRTMNR